MAALSVGLLLFFKGGHCPAFDIFLGTLESAHGDALSKELDAEWSFSVGLRLTKFEKYEKKYFENMWTIRLEQQRFETPDDNHQWNFLAAYFAYRRFLILSSGSVIVLPYVEAGLGIAEIKVSRSVPADRLHDSGGMPFYLRTGMDIGSIVKGGLYIEYQNTLFHGYSRNFANIREGLSVNFIIPISM